MSAFSKLKKTSSVLFVLIVVLGILFIKSFFVIVDAGHVGITSTFGKISDQYLASGFHFKNPFSKVTQLTTRTSSYTMSSVYSEGEVQGDDSVEALAKDGGQVWFDVTVLYRVEEKSAPKIYKDLGVNFQENIIRPQIRAIIRGEAANFNVNELYSTKREEVQKNIFTKLSTVMEQRGIVIEDVLLRNVIISDQLLQSIELKLAAEQEVQRLTFEVQKAKKEADRKREEAKGQRDAQQIISQGLTDKYLYYLYINSLKDRAGTIYVPINPENGLPIFKGVE